MRIVNTMKTANFLPKLDMIPGWFLKYSTGNRWINDYGTRKGILRQHRNKTNSLFSQHQKRVQFNDPETREENKSNKTQEKWRKYVAQQFKILQICGKTKKHVKKNIKKYLISKQDNTRCIKESSSEENSDDCGNINQLLEFQLPNQEIIHQKKDRKNGSKNTRLNLNAKIRNSKTIQNTIKQSTDQPNHHDNEQQNCDEKNNRKSFTPNTPMEKTLVMKRPMNAFFIFSKQCREEFRDIMLPTFGTKGINMVLGNVWRFLSKHERQSFYEEARRLRKEFDESKQHTVGERQSEKNTVKRPLNAFLLFCQQERVQMNGKYHAMSGYIEEGETQNKRFDLNKRLDLNKAMFKCNRNTNESVATCSSQIPLRTGSNFNVGKELNINNQSSLFNQLNARDDTDQHSNLSLSVCEISKARTTADINLDKVAEFWDVKGIIKRLERFDFSIHVNETMKRKHNDEDSLLEIYPKAFMDERHKRH